MRYELETIYQAFVDCDDNCARLYFVVDYGGNRITVKDAYDVDWHIFAVHKACPTIRYECNSGIWCLNCDRWGLERGDHWHSSVVTKADDKDPHVKDNLHGEHRPMKGKHYNVIIEDDIVDAYRYGLWSIEKEVNEEMKEERVNQLYDVIFFNKETEVIDFRDIILAPNREEAYLLAVQKFGKYDPKVHIKAALNLLTYNVNE